ncbi:hypothetical protein J1N35_022823 [Gossypium stocksii]|uniref:Uncharacterized protein n=1 Tax=Gossypium stocksii TaxID=47602 RepID=A0A9D4A342_9ROSI|nr:hypothetical protein J1N35_022823 [Gossypium stocksii]
MDLHSSNSQPKGWVTHGSNGLKKKSSYANVVTSSRKECAYDGLTVKCHYNKLTPRDTSWSDLNSGRRFYGCSDFQDNLELRKSAMDLVAFDGNHNGDSNAVDIEVERGRSICGVEGEVALRKKMLTMKQKIKVIKKKKLMYTILFSCFMLCIVCIIIGFFFGSTGKRHMKLAVANVD